MRATHAIAIGGALMLAAAGCAASYQVRTLIAPEAQFVTLHTFRVLPVPPPRAERDDVDAYDPMVNNSIANRTLREAVMAAFEERGYRADPHAPDFLVAVYANAHEQFDLTAWDHGDPYWPRGGLEPHVRTRDQLMVYAEGTVVIDVIEPATGELLWRGSATTALTKDPARDVGELARAAGAVVKRFPAAMPRAVVASR
jgi:hypothetical protein